MQGLCHKATTIQSHPQRALGGCFNATPGNPGFRGSALQEPGEGAFPDLSVNPGAVI